MVCSVFLKKKGRKRVGFKTNVTPSGAEQLSVDASQKIEIMSESFFGPLWPYIKDRNITDVDFNGRELWITDCNSHRRKVADIPLTKQFVNVFTGHVANMQSREFNKLNPVLEAETEELRISIVNEVVAKTGTSVCIRKTPTFARITVEDSLKTKYATKEILSFLTNAVRAHCNIVVCGEPGVGKTEACKFVSTFINENERVITIEDNLEWHYSKLKPLSDCIEMQVSKRFSYTDAIVTCLRQNPRWMMISEIRGNEAKEYVQALSTGVNGITTLHTDDVRNIPDRVVNMIADRNGAARVENDIYTFVDIGVLVNKKIVKVGNEEKMHRYIDQVGAFVIEDGIKKCYMIFEDGKFVKNPYDESGNLSLDNFLPQHLRTKFKRALIDNPFENGDVIRQANNIK